MSYRHQRDALSNLAGRAARRIRSLLSRRQLDLDESNGERVTALGREALDGSVEQDEMDAFSPMGFVARPAANATVEAAVSFIGADGAHPIALSYLDHGRRAVIDAVGLKADETIVYTSRGVIKLLADGTIEARSLDGTAKSLAYKSDAEALNARIAEVEAAFNHFEQEVYNKHGHGALGAGVPSMLVEQETQTSAEIEGSSILKAQ